MLEFLFKRKKNEEKKDAILNEFYTKLRRRYNFDNISVKRKTELKNTISKYGYLNYPHVKALEELTNEEVLYGLELKWKKNNVFKNGKFSFANNAVSPLARNNVKNSDWIKKEGHNIKLINLAGLGDGNNTEATGKFFDWLRQLLILPTGDLNNNIFNTTIYLIPFHPREFGCAYLPKSSEVSDALLDKDLEQITGLNVKQQVQMFIELAQLAGHPVIYDILPQTGRFSKAVLANPYIARWFDITEIQNMVLKKIETAAQILKEAYDKEDVDVVKDIYIQSLNGSTGNLTEHYQNIFNHFEKEMDELKRNISNKMLTKDFQIKIHKRVKDIVAEIHGFKNNKKIEEDDITKQIDTIQELIKEGLWPAPGGAWCSAGVPIYDKMSECGGYPIFKHYDYKGEDVTNFANLDCQTPYYFAFLEDGTLNRPVINFFVEYMQKLQEDYNFDGFRVDHIDHIVDKVSEKDGKPISYRAPRTVLNELNTEMKKKIPYFGTLAEYMLWDNYLKEYHEDMNFDILWGNDIICQQSKTPECIVEDNQNLTNYNINFKSGEKLSILKTYNNQDGEFREIDQYPGQLTPEGALFKWAKYKLLPGGKYAQRPVLYIDGDESFTKRGIESVIGEEKSMPREKNYDFYTKFDALDRFVKSQPIITDGEAQIITQDEDGFAVWLISKEPLKKAFLIATNFNYPTEFISINDENGCRHEWKKGISIENKTIKLPGDFSLQAEYILQDNKYSAKRFDTPKTELSFDELKPAEFRIYALQKA
ncbi:MAG: hypothetical protein KH301_02740 [Brachyspira sp.]|nr:hypothetical protein [Brachyspira sp.]